MANNASSHGLGIGGAIAVTVSWSLNNHLGWAILHGLFGWLYVIYVALGFGGVR